jgi:hypothetical protein
MGNISIYLNDSQQQKLDLLASKGIAEDVKKNLSSVSTERSRSALVGLIIEQEYAKLLEAEMIADALVIDREDLGWSEAEEQCQIIDLEQFGG